MRRGVVRRSTPGLALLAVLSLLALGRAGFVRPASGVKGGSYVVTTNQDNFFDSGDGFCSLREAIHIANGEASQNDCGHNDFGASAISFNIGTGTPRIAISPAYNSLPAITSQVFIDGHGNGADRVEISGSGIVDVGLTFAGGDGSTVRNMVLNGFGLAAIESVSPNVSISGNYIGTDASGAVAVPNGTGIRSLQANGLIIGGTQGLTAGGPCTGDCNLISGNGGGVAIFNLHSSTSAPMPVVQGNFIGTDFTGTVAIANQIGVSVGGDSGLIGSSLPGQGNLLSGNQDGIQLQSSKNVVIQGNLIGVAADGSSPLGNSRYGIDVQDSSATFVGGGSGQGNVIAYNASWGVITETGSSAAVNQNSIFSNGGGITTPIHILPPIPTITGVNPVRGDGCATCTIEVFSDEDGQGRIYERSTIVDANGSWTLSASVTGPNVTATQTQYTGGQYATSEFSASFPVPVTPTPSSSPTQSASPTSTTTLTQTPTSTPTHTASPTPTHTPTVERVEGDLDCDGHINLVDFDLLLEFVGQLNNGLTPGACPDLYELFQGRRWGDFNCDGFLTARDSLYLLEYVAEATGLPHPAPPCPEIGTQLA